MARSQALGADIREIDGLKSRAAMVGLSLWCLGDNQSAVGLESLTERVSCRLPSLQDSHFTSRESWLVKNCKVSW